MSGASPSDDDGSRNGGGDPKGTPADGAAEGAAARGKETVRVRAVGGTASERLAHGADTSTGPPEGTGSEAGACSERRATNVSWQRGDLSRRQRWQSLGARGATVWFTGLPSSGKSTLGAAVEARLVEEGRHAYLLDGDNLRHGICSDLGFSQEDRDRNVRRVGELAALFADSGTIALVALVSPYEATRRAVRERHERDGLAFIEVFIDTPLWLCVERDPKGLYAQALRGQLESFTGIDDPYERPRAADVALTPALPLERAVEQVLARLDQARTAGEETARRRERERLERERVAAGGAREPLRLL